MIVHCQTGIRSVIAASLLRATGLPDPINLEGGFSAWRAAGYPVEVLRSDSPVAPDAVHAAPWAGSAR